MASLNCWPKAALAADAARLSCSPCTAAALFGRVVVVGQFESAIESWRLPSFLG